MLKSKKERLNHTLERLALQAGHKVWILSGVWAENWLLMKILLAGEAVEDVYELWAASMIRASRFGCMHNRMEYRR